MVERVNYDFLPQALGPYVHATKYKSQLYVSGLTAMNTDSQSGRLDEQVMAIFEQLNLILSAENKTVDDLIKVTIFLSDISQLSELREHLNNFYGGVFPACSLVEVSRFVHSDLKVEIEALIALD